MDELPVEPRLAHTRLAHDRHQLAVAGARALQLLPKTLQLVVAPDKPS